jgi:hypothetical protein
LLTNHLFRHVSTQKLIQIWISTNKKAVFWHLCRMYLINSFFVIWSKWQISCPVCLLFFKWEFFPLRIDHVWNGYNVPTSLDVNGLWDVGLMSLCLIMGSFGTRMARASSIDLMIISSRIISCPAMDSVLVVERARSWSAWSYSYSSLSFRIASSSMKSL